MENSETCASNRPENEPFTPEELLKVAQRYVKDNFHLPHEVMEDLKMDFILAAYEAERDAKHREGIRSYQYCAGCWAVSGAARWWRCRNRHEMQGPGDIYDGVFDEDDSVLNLIIEKEADRRVQAALEHLPERTRQIVELHVLDDWSFERIGEALEIDASWANRIFNKGMHVLKQELGDPEDPE